MMMNKIDDLLINKSPGTHLFLFQAYKS